MAGGPDSEHSGSQSISVVDHVVSGREGNGSVIFFGNFNSISWRNTVFENYYGFTVGMNGGSNVIPVPAAVWLFGTGLMGLGAFSRRKRVAA